MFFFRMPMKSRGKRVFLNSLTLNDIMCMSTCNAFEKETLKKKLRKCHSHSHLFSSSILIMFPGMVPVFPSNFSLLCPEGSPNTLEHAFRPQ